LTQSSAIKRSSSNIANSHLAADGRLPLNAVAKIAAKLRAVLCGNGSDHVAAVRRAEDAYVVVKNGCAFGKNAWSEILTSFGKMV
jgi:hypothetical protein